MDRHQASHEAIREYLCDGRGSRKVRISADGRVEYYGSPVETCQSEGYWHDGGWVEGYTIDAYGNTYG